MHSELTNKFCMHFIQSKPKIIFNGIKVDSQLNVLVLTTIDIPILSYELNAHQLPLVIESFNAGFYKNNSKVELEIAKTSIIIPGKPLYQLNENQCNSFICPIESISITKPSNCVNQIINYNSTKGCTLVATEDTYCKVIQIPNKYIVSINSGLMLSSRWSIKTIILKYETLLIPYGQIFCNNQYFNYTINLPEQTNYTTHIKIVSNVTLDPIVELEYNKTQEVINFIPTKLQSHNYLGSASLSLHLIIYYLIITNILVLFCFAKISAPKIIRFLRHMKLPQFEKRSKQKSKTRKGKTTTNKNKSKISNSYEFAEISELNLVDSSTL